MGGLLFFRPEFLCVFFFLWPALVLLVSEQNWNYVVFLPTALVFFRKMLTMEGKTVATTKLAAPMGRPQ